MHFPEPIDEILPKRFESWLFRQGWKLSKTSRNVWELPGRTNSENWQVLIVDLDQPNRQQHNRESIAVLAHIYCCRQWEIEAVLKVEPIVFGAGGSPSAHGTIELFDQREFDIFDYHLESTDHNPAEIIVDDDGGDLLIAAIVSARYGWGSSVETFGRGGGSFTLTIGRLHH